MENLTIGSFASLFYTKNCPHLRHFRLSGHVNSSQRHINMQQQLIKKHILTDNELCSFSITDLKGYHIEGFLERTVAKSGYNRTTKAIIDLLKLILAELYRQDLTEKDLSKKIKRIKYEEKERGCLTVEEVYEFLKPNYYENTFERALFATSLLCGLRRGEVLALHWHDIDFKHNCVRVKNAWKDTKTLGKPKNGKARVTWLPPLAKILLSALREEQKDDSNGDLIFKSRFKGCVRLSETYVQKHFRKIMARMGTDCVERNIVFHSLRHSLKSYLATTDLPFEQQCMLLGWSESTRDEMARRYTHFDESKVDDYIEQGRLNHDVEQQINT